MANNNIPISHEGRRGCGYRKVGGIYLRGIFLSKPCGRLPIALTTCPSCGRGIRPSRGWTWVEPTELLRATEEEKCGTPALCNKCPIGKGIEDMLGGQAGLIWIGEKHYPTPQAFIKESRAMGISRRLNSVPRDFILGETWVLLAHRLAIHAPLEIGKEPEWTPGIFQIFKPTSLEIVCDGNESDETIESYKKRDLTPVIVRPIGENDNQKELKIAQHS